MDLKPILLTILCALIGSIGQLEFKRGSENLQFTLHALITNYHLIAGVLLYAFSTLIYVYALSLGKLSLLYPIIATSYVWATLLAKVFLNEPINTQNWIGLALILIGVTLIAWQK